MSGDREIMSARSNNTTSHPAMWGNSRAKSCVNEYCLTYSVESTLTCTLAARSRVSGIPPPCPAPQASCSVNYTCCEASICMFPYLTDETAISPICDRFTIRLASVTRIASDIIYSGRGTRGANCLYVPHRATRG